MKDIEREEAGEMMRRMKIMVTGLKYFRRIDVHTNDMPQKSMAASG